MTTLKILLLGGFELRGGDEPLPPPATLKARSLLAYLVVHRDRVCPREVLADLFWPDRPRDKALHNLSTALWHIRRVLPPGDYILADARAVRFNRGSEYWLDVEEFEKLVNWETGTLVDWETGRLVDWSQERTTNVPMYQSTNLPTLREAVALYKGDFLEGFYDDWCLEERYRLEGLYLEALERLVAAHEALGQPEEALRYAGLLLARDPLREDVHRAVIRLHVRLGNRAEALRQARWCRAVLRTELGIEPALETVALCDELLGLGWRRGPSEEVLAQRSHPPRSQPAFILERSPFVGRKTEWEALLTRWERAKSGQGHLVLVSGEAGIGKTRLVEELSQYIRQRGGWVACGRCYEYERALPHSPLADLLRAVLSVTGARVLDRLPPWQAAELARLAPEVGERSPSPPFIPPQVGGGEEGVADQQQARLFDALTLLLLDLAQRNPLLLMLEDLHWAQDSTLAWLHYLARHLPQAHILLVATYQSEEVGPDRTLHGLALQLERSELATRLELTRLPQEALGHWMAGASDALVARIYRQTEGNPFFTLETLRALLEEGQVQFVEGRWVEKTALSSLPIPTSVRQVIQARLERLSPSVREAVATASVIGRAFDFDVLEQAWGQGEEATLEALDELLRRRLVRESSGPSSRDYEFDHHLVREVIYRGLHYRRRRRLHRLAGQAMERLYAGQPGVAGELAHHFEHGHETEKALAWLVEAGEEARLGYALQEALGYFRRALALLDPERADGLAARALTGLAVTHRDVVGEKEVTWGWLGRALSIWETLGNRGGVAQTCYALAYQHADFDRARAVVRRGLDAVNGTPGLEGLTSRGYGLLARFYEHEGNFAHARLWAQRQLELSERIGDQRGLAHAHHRLGSLILRIGGPMSEAVAHEQEAARLAEDLGWLDFASGSHNIAGYCLLTLGRTTEAETKCRLALRLSAEPDISWRKCWAYHYLAEIASLRGEWEQAARLLDRAESTMIRQSTHFQEIVLLRARGQLVARQGNPASARPLLETALEMSQRFYPRYVPELELELAVLSLDEGDETAARQWLLQAREQAEQRGMAHTLAVADLLQGRLAARSGDWPTAEAAFAEGLRRCEELEQVVEAARTRLAWGRALLARGKTARGREMLQAALVVFDEAGAAPEVEQVRRALAAHPASNLPLPGL